MVHSETNTFPAGQTPAYTAHTMTITNTSKPRFSASRLIAAVFSFTLFFFLLSNLVQVERLKPEMAYGLVTLIPLLFSRRGLMTVLPLTILLGVMVTITYVVRENPFWVVSLFVITSLLFSFVVDTQWFYKKKE